MAEKREVHASILGFLPMEFLRNMGKIFGTTVGLRATLRIEESIIRYKGKWLQASVLGFLPVQHPLSWEVQLWNSHCHDAWPEFWQERKREAQASILGFLPMELPSNFENFLGRPFSVCNVGG